MSYEIAEAFKNSHAELQRLMGNAYLAYDETGEPLPSGFRGLSKEEAFSNYVNRTITTDQSVGFLEPNYYIARSGEPENRLRIWRIEKRIIQGQQIGTIIYTTSLPAQSRVVMASNGLLAV